MAIPFIGIMAQPSGYFEIPNNTDCTLDVKVTWYSALSGPAYCPPNCSSYVGDSGWFSLGNGGSTAISTATMGSGNWVGLIEIRDSQNDIEEHGYCATSMLNAVDCQGNDVTVNWDCLLAEIIHG